MAMNSMDQVFKIKKTLINIEVSVFMNDGLGQVAYWPNRQEAERMCIILNANSDSNCKYTVYSGRTQDEDEFGNVHRNNR